MLLVSWKTDCWEDVLARRLCQHHQTPEEVTYRPSTYNVLIAMRGCPRTQRCGHIANVFIRILEWRLILALSRKNQTLTYLY